MVTNQQIPQGIERWNKECECWCWMMLICYGECFRCFSGGNARVTPASHLGFRGAIVAMLLGSLAGQNGWNLWLQLSPEKKTDVLLETHYVQKRESSSIIPKYPLVIFTSSENKSSPSSKKQRILIFANLSHPSATWIHIFPSFFHKLSIHRI